MKKISKILAPLLVLLMFVQGVSLVATCAVPCNMNAGDKVRCIVDSIVNYQHMRAQDRSGAIRPGAVACGHLEMTGRITTAPTEVARLSPAISNFSFLNVPSVSGISVADLKLLNFNRAGPVGSGSSQALLAVPPQNAPPVLV